jgi:hypothetical protein
MRMGKNYKDGLTTFADEIILPSTLWIEARLANNALGFG